LHRLGLLKFERKGQYATHATSLTANEWRERKQIFFSSICKFFPSFSSIKKCFHYLTKYVFSGVLNIFFIVLLFFIWLLKIDIPNNMDFSCIYTSASTWALEFT
jgi:hypothetical protein